MTTLAPDTDWADTEIGRIATSDATRALARRYCRPNSLGITAEHVYAEALATMWRNRYSGEFYDPDGYIRSRLSWAYQGLVRQRLRETRAEVGRPPTGSEDGTVDVEPRLLGDGWIRDVQAAITLRLAELGPRDEARARALATVLNLLAIAANDGCLPAVAPQRSSRLEESERDRLAATWMADPALRTIGDSVDSPSTRKRRQRLMELVREEFGRALTQLIDADTDAESVGGVEVGWLAGVAA